MIASLNAKAVRELGVEPTLDVISIGHAEGRVLYNPSPERDSVFEFLPHAVDRSRPESRHLAKLLVQVKTLNGEQTDRAKDVCGWLDGLAVDLKRKRSGSQPLAKALRPHLRTLADARAMGREVAAAFREVERITLGLSREALTSPALAHQLGPKRFALLQDVIADRGAGS